MIRVNIILAAVLAFNSMFMMLAPTHASSVDEMFVMEDIDNRMAVDNCAGIHCNFVFDAEIKAPAFYFKETMSIGLTTEVVDFFPFPLKKPPRNTLV